MEAATIRADEEKKNIVMFPFMAQGHIIPFLALALKIHNLNHNIIITIVNTPLNIKNIISTLPHNLPIEFLDLPFNSSDHGLPPQAENTDVLPYPLVIRLIRAGESLKQPFSNLISELIERNRSPVCIISDIFLGWTVDVAKKFGIYHAIFCGGGGFGFACYFSVWINMPHKKVVVESTFTLPDFPEAGKFQLSQLPANQLNADGKDQWSIFQASNLPKWIESDTILFNTVEELDSHGLAYFKRCTEKQVWAIGPVVLPPENRASKKQGIKSEQCMKWLDSKPENSVLYISFGSNNTISAPNMMQLAMALETSRVNFIWVVRPPLGFDINSEFRDLEWLPGGFVKRMSDGGRGLVVHNWAPQVDILSHRSVACFLSHCGWGSVMEALSEGVSILGWPMAGEQFYNAKFLDEMVGVCVEVARGNGCCEVKCKELSEKIGLVMTGEKSEEMRKKAANVKEMVKGAVVKGNSSAKAMDEFLKVIKC